MLPLLLQKNNGKIYRRGMAGEGNFKLQVEGYEDPNNTPFIQKGHKCEYERTGYTDKLQWYQNPKFYDKIKENAKDIRTLKFTGGEPTLIPLSSR